MDKSAYIKELVAEREEMLDYIRERGHMVGKDTTPDPDSDIENSLWEAGYAKALEDVIFTLRRRVV